MSWKKNRSFINVMQIIIDILCIFVNYLITIFFTSIIFHVDVLSQDYLWIPVLFGMVYIFAMYISEMYHRSTFTYQDRTLRYVLRSGLLAAVFCLVMIPFTTKDIFTVNVLMIYILAAIIVHSMQYLIMQELRQLFSNKWNKRAIFIGNIENIQEYLYYINKTSFKIDIIDCISFHAEWRVDKKQKSMDKLKAALTANVVDEVIFAVPCMLMEDIRPLVLFCKEQGLTVRLAVNFYEDLEQKNTVHNVGTIPVFTYYNAALNDFQCITKRAMDIIGSLIGVFITLIASIFIVPLALIQTGRPVIQRSKHLSVNGRNFTLLSFRTVMENDKSEYFVSRFLRRTSMDNLPMFWNVLKGDMTLVGSLPIPATNSDALNNNSLKNTALKPGLTGDWRFKDKQKLYDGDYLAKLYNNYLNKWSFSKDCWIILKTIALILTNKPTVIGTSLFACLEDNQAYSVKSA